MHDIPNFPLPCCRSRLLARLPQHAVTSCPARHASTRRVPDICNMHHTLFFVLHTHRDCGASSLADLRQRPRRPAPSTRDGDALGPGRRQGVIQVRLSHGECGPSARGRGRGVWPERVTRCCLLSVLVPMLVQMLCFQFCPFALARLR